MNRSGRTPRSAETSVADTSTSSTRNVGEAAGVRRSRSVSHRILLGCRVRQRLFRPRPEGPGAAPGTKLRTPRVGTATWPHGDPEAPRSEPRRDRRAGVPHVPAARDRNGRRPRAGRRGRLPHQPGGRGRAGGRLSLRRGARPGRAGDGRRRRPPGLRLPRGERRVRRGGGRRRARLRRAAAGGDPRRRRQARGEAALEGGPSPALDAGLRAAMGEAAVAFARAVGYENAGTAEFMLTGGEFFFLELNARLKVEHPVTELVTGIDLVEQQLLIAAAEPLAVEPREPEGHAVEVRLYAEHPLTFLPQAGRLERLELPESVRVDPGVAAGGGLSGPLHPPDSKDESP